jgi:hypothetical protein
LTDAARAAGLNKNEVVAQAEEAEEAPEPEKKTEKKPKKKSKE